MKIAKLIGDIIVWIILCFMFPTVSGIALMLVFINKLCKRYNIKTYCPFE